MIGPAGAGESQQPHPGHGASLSRIGGHPGRKRVRGVHYCVDLSSAQVIDQALNPTEAADPGAHLATRLRGASGHRPQHSDPGGFQRGGQFPAVGGTTQQEDSHVPQPIARMKEQR